MTVLGKVMRGAAVGGNEGHSLPVSSHRLVINFGTSSRSDDDIEGKANVKTDVRS